MFSVPCSETLGNRLKYARNSGEIASKYLDDSMYLLRDQINRYAGANASKIGISLTETNVGVGQNTQPGAIFLADAYSSLIANGVFTVQWWNVHNGIGTPSTVAGQTDYNDFGLLSSGTCTSDGTVCEPPLNTPFAPYHALKLMSSFVHPGDHNSIQLADGELRETVEGFRRSGQLLGEARVLEVYAFELAPFPVPADTPALTPIPPAEFRVETSQQTERAPFLVDGDNDTRWIGVQDGSAMIAARFSEPRDVARIELQLAERSLMDYPRDLQIDAEDKAGRVRTCDLDRKSFVAAEGWLSTQRELWQARTDRLEQFVLSDRRKGK